MADKIYVAVKRPGELPRHVWMANSLENFQRYVGGYIETVTLATDLVIICNEEGRLRELPYNCTICGVDLVGDIVIAGAKDDEFADLPCNWKTLKTLLPSLWEANDGNRKTETA